MTSSPSIPPYAGVCTSEDARRTGFSVTEAARRLRRIATAQQRLAFIATAHLNATPEWEIKSALALHAWLDAQHASALRERLIELREPTGGLPGNPEAAADPALAVAFDEALHSRGSVELLTAIYGVLRPALLVAVERYLRDTNPLADQPTCRIL